MGAPITSTNFAKALWPGVNSWYGKEYDEFPVEHTELFEQSSTNRAYIEDVGISPFGLLHTKPEGQAIAYDEESQAYVTRYTMVTYGLGFQITREIYEDDLYDVVGERRARALAFSVRQTQEVVGANVYNRAFNASYVGGNGVEMCSETQALYNGGTLSNRVAGDPALSEAGLEAAMIQASKWTDERGKRINVQGVKLIVPSDEQFEAARILKSPYRPGISPGNTAGGGLHDINAIYTMGMLPEGYCVNHYLTDDNAWFLRTSVKKDGLKHVVRREPQFAVDNDFETENAKYKSTYRDAFGWTDWRAIIGSNPA